jgi:hypothetical protein
MVRIHFPPAESQQRTVRLPELLAGDGGNFGTVRLVDCVPARGRPGPAFTISCCWQSRGDLRAGSYVVQLARGAPGEFVNDG